MSRAKRSSAILDKAQIRMAALKSIDTSLDLGNGLTVESFSEVIEDTRQQLEAYNTALSTVDQTRNMVAETEKMLAELCERMLAGVASKYGKNSDEYQMAGGVRKRDRKRNTRKVSKSISA
ncbi:hypothetical protein H6G41_23545 [Tolypothrix sp. FACHB-123]|uniref:hypothetical protein n=1 Tax=Tolypothrix sp. FACHB-123 TaxID=2692868 RepID=UPI001685EA9F|nr:hypothetical protein [Tolypothrix sp. FACHB-123]MBD2357551.1 hypothetical protein [Tolypothrix sp. FACHB-123]